MSRTDPPLDRFLRENRAVLARGPLAIVGIEDDVELDATFAWLRRQGFATQIALAGPGVTVPQRVRAQGLHVVTHDIFRDDGMVAAINAVLDAVPDGVWIYWGYNAEFLFYPFCETRPVTALLSFHAEERRDAMVASVIDLYTPDLARHPNGVDHAGAHFDTIGYYADARRDPENGYAPKERQLDFFGGLRWRYEEHVPWERRQIGRVSLARAKAGLRLRSDFTFSDEEYNTHACPWHRNLTAAVASFRAVKALRENPSSANAIDSFLWHGSAPFDWRSEQLLDLGMMEAGQWF